MTDTPIFTARQHLEAYIRAIQTVYEQSPHTSDLLVAGAFEACLERINFLHDQIDKYQARGQADEDMINTYIESQTANLERIAELETEIQAIIERYA